MSVSDFKGSVVLLFVWSNYCSTCVEKLPILQRLHETFGDQGLVIVSVWRDAVMDGKKHDSAKERRRAEKSLQTAGVTFSTTFLSVGATEEFFGRFDLPGDPTVWLFDRQGLLVYANVGNRALEETVRLQLTRR